MQRLISYVLIAVAVVGAHMVQAQTAGLNYQTYASTGPSPSYTQASDGSITNRTLLSSGTVSTVNYQWGSGAVLNSGRGDGVIVRFYGFISIPTAGLYYFGGNADDGIRITVNNTSVVNSWIESGGAFRSGGVNLPAGVLPIEVMYYENGGGAMINLQWYIQNTGTWQIVPSTMLTTAPPGPQYPSYMTVEGNPGTMTYGTSSAVTNQQQTRINSADTRRSTVSDNSIYIDQVGDNNTVTVSQDSRHNQVRGVGQQAAVISGNFNTVTVRQGNPTGALGRNLLELSVSGNSNTLNLNQGVNANGTTDAADSNNHYQLLNLAGSNNNITTVQKDNLAGTGHFMETTITGNGNVLDFKQTNAGNKTMFATVTGNNNTATVTQKDSGAHYLDMNFLGNGNDAQVTQSGNTRNAATINLTNNGAPASVTLQQSGGQTYNIDRSCTTTCGRVTVNQ